MQSHRTLPHLDPSSSISIALTTSNVLLIYVPIFHSCTLQGSYGIVPKKLLQRSPSLGGKTIKMFQGKVMGAKKPWTCRIILCISKRHSNENMNMLELNSLTPKGFKIFHAFAIVVHSTSLFMEECSTWSFLMILFSPYFMLSSRACSSTRMSQSSSEDKCNCCHQVSIPSIP